MKKPILLFLCAILFCSCQDKFGNKYAEAISWAYRAYDEIDNLSSAALEYRTSESLEEQWEVRRRKQDYYYEKKSRYNTLLVKMNEYDALLMGMVASSSNNNKKKDAYRLYHKLHNETIDLIREACWIVEDISKDNIEAFRAKRTTVKELHDKIDKDYIKEIHAGRNPFK